MKRLHIALLAISLALTAAASAQQAGQGIVIFLKLQGIAGDNPSTYAHTNEISAQTVSFGAGQPALATNAGSAGAGAAKAQLSTITIQKLTDKTSPTLFLDCALGKLIPSAKITFRNTNLEGQPDFFYIDLINVLIGSYRVDASAGDGFVEETLTLSFSSMKISLVPVMPDGSLGTPISTGFNVVKNKEDETIVP